ncbi:unnamed protein product [Closterium sp. NIES-65]|nr:unnamed protein product [Closterium sp. NIES-65]
MAVTTSAAAIGAAALHAFADDNDNIEAEISALQDKICELQACLLGPGLLNPSPHAADTPAQTLAASTCTEALLQSAFASDTTAATSDACVLEALSRSPSKGSTLDDSLLLDSVLANALLPQLLPAQQPVAEGALARRGSSSDAASTLRLPEEAAALRRSAPSRGSNLPHSSLLLDAALLPQRLATTEPAPAESVPAEPMVAEYSPPAPDDPAVSPMQFARTNGKRPRSPLLVPPDGLYQHRESLYRQQQDEHAHAHGLYMHHLSLGHHEGGRGISSPTVPTSCPSPCCSPRPSRISPPSLASLDLRCVAHTPEASPQTALDSSLQYHLQHHSMAWQIDGRLFLVSPCPPSLLSPAALPGERAAEARGPRALLQQNARRIAASDLVVLGPVSAAVKAHSLDSHPLIPSLTLPGASVSPSALPPHLAASEIAARIPAGAAAFAPVALGLRVLLNPSGGARKVTIPVISPAAHQQLLTWQQQQRLRTWQARRNAYAIALQKQEEEEEQQQQHEREELSHNGGEGGAGGGVGAEVAAGATGRTERAAGTEGTEGAGGAEGDNTGEGCEALQEGSDLSQEGSEAAVDAAVAAVNQAGQRLVLMMRSVDKHLSFWRRLALASPSQQLWIVLFRRGPLAFLHTSLSLSLSLALSAANRYLLPLLPSPTLPPSSSSRPPPASPSSNLVQPSSPQPSHSLSANRVLTPEGLLLGLAAPSLQGLVREMVAEKVVVLGEVQLALSAAAGQVREKRGWGVGEGGEQGRKEEGGVYLSSAVIPAPSSLALSALTTTTATSSSSIMSTSPPDPLALLSSILQACHVAVTQASGIYGEKPTSGAGGPEGTVESGGACSEAVSNEAGGELGGAGVAEDGSGLGVSTQGAVPAAAVVSPAVVCGQAKQLNEDVKGLQKLVSAAVGAGWGGWLLGWVTAGVGDSWGG